MPMICHCIFHLGLNGGCSSSPDPLVEGYPGPDGKKHAHLKRDWEAIHSEVF